MSGETVYGLDTNSLLTAWNETYRPASFGGFWTRLDELAGAGRAVVCEEVFTELARKDDDVHKWIKARSGMVVPLEPEQMRIAKQLASEFPTLAKQRLGRMRADGFVIALGKWKGLTVVTAENHRGADKIPNICDAKDVRCISLADMIAAEGWRF